MAFAITAADLLNDNNFIIIDGNGCADCLALLADKIYMLDIELNP